MHGKLQCKRLFLLGNCKSMLFRKKKLVELQLTVTWGCLSFLKYLWHFVCHLKIFASEIYFQYFNLFFFFLFACICMWNLIFNFSISGTAKRTWIRYCKRYAFLSWNIYDTLSVILKFLRLKYIFNILIYIFSFYLHAYACEVWSSISVSLELQREPG